MQSEQNQKNQGDPVARFCRNVAVIAGFVAALACVLIVVNYFQMKTHDPTENKSISTLLERLEKNPDDQELKEQIRALDLMVRKAYFTKQWQIQAGGYILLGSVLVLLAALKTAQVRQGGIRTTGGAREASGTAWQDALSARNALITLGVFVCAAALVTAYVSRKQLTRIPVEAGTDKQGKTVSSEQSGGTEQATEEENRRQARQEQWATMQQNWPSFRGPGNAGRSFAEIDPPIRWDGKSGENVVWKKEVPLPGRNSPVIWKGHLFIAGATKTKEEVFCFDARTGELLWRSELTGIRRAPDEPPNVTKDTGYAPSTVATAGDAVYAVFPTGNIAGFDFEGNQIWGKNLGLPDNPYGHASSLVAYDGMVFVQYDQADDASIRALDAETGSVVWKTERDVNPSWASPLLFDPGRADGQLQIVLNASPAVAAYAPRTGKRLWRAECMSGEVAPSPTYANGTLFVVNQYANAVALNPDNGETIWKTNKTQLPNAASPVATDELLFIPTNFGMFSCLKTETGKVAWKHSFKEGSFSSPVLVGERIYWTTFDGTTHIFEAADAYSQIATPELGEECVTTPAFVDNRIYLRGQKHLFCISREK